MADLATYHPDCYTASITNAELTSIFTSYDAIEVSDSVTVTGVGGTVTVDNPDLVVTGAGSFEYPSGYFSISRLAEWSVDVTALHFRFSSTCECAGVNVHDCDISASVEFGALAQYSAPCTTVYPDVTGATFTNLYVKSIGGIIIGATFEDVVVGEEIGWAGHDTTWRRVEVCKDWVGQNLSTLYARVAWISALKMGGYVESTYDNTFEDCTSWGAAEENFGSDIMGYRVAYAITAVGADYVDVTRVDGNRDLIYAGMTAWVMDGDGHGEYYRVAQNMAASGGRLYLSDMDRWGSTLSIGQHLLVGRFFADNTIINYTAHLRPWRHVDWGYYAYTSGLGVYSGGCGNRFIGGSVIIDPPHVANETVYLAKGSMGISDFSWNSRLDYTDQFEGGTGSGIYGYYGLNSKNEYRSIDIDTGVDTPIVVNTEFYPFAASEEQSMGEEEMYSTSPWLMTVPTTSVDISFIDITYDPTFTPNVNYSKVIWGTNNSSLPTTVCMLEEYGTDDFGVDQGYLDVVDTGPNTLNLVEYVDNVYFDFTLGAFLDAVEPVSGSVSADTSIVGYSPDYWYSTDGSIWDDGTFWVAATNSSITEREVAAGSHSAAAGVTGVTTVRQSVSGVVHSATSVEGDAVSYAGSLLFDLAPYFVAETISAGGSVSALAGIAGDVGQVNYISVYGWVEAGAGVSGSTGIALATAEGYFGSLAGVVGSLTFDSGWQARPPNQSKWSKGIRDNQSWSKREVESAEWSEGRITVSP